MLPTDLPEPGSQPASLPARAAHPVSSLAAVAATLALGVVSGVCLGGSWFPHRRAAALAVVFASVLVALARAALAAAPTRSDSAATGLQVAERYAPLVVILFYVPVFTHAVAPGADMAMHAALARALRDNSSWLSPAWGNVHAAAYPLGFSAWIALLGSVVDLGSASVLASASAFALYYCGLQRFISRALGLPCARLLSAFLLTASWTPQAFYRWGGGPSVLAMALGLCAAAEIPQLCRSKNTLAAASIGMFISLLLMAAMTTHPIGASIGAACCGAIGVRECIQQPRAALTRSWVFVPLALVMWWLSHNGPELSVREHAWIYHFRTVDENVLGTWPRWLCPLTVWRAVFVRVGPAVSACFVVSCFALWQRARRTVVVSVVLIELLGLVLAYGPELPGLGFLVYPSRLMPAAVLFLAAPLSAAHQLAHDQLGERAKLLGGVLLALSALGVHIGLYQTAQPMVTRNDAAALRCLAQRIPDDAVIDGAYGDATQWIPALTGRAITHPHVHCSLFDEVDAELARKHASYRFSGERVCFGAALAPAAPLSAPICRYGAARLDQP